MTTASSLKKRGVRLTQRAVNPRGRLPRRGYEHCFIEEEGVHSRLHLHHFYSMFLPDVNEPVDAHVHVFGSGGARVGVVTRTLQPLTSLVLPMTDVLAELTSTETLGSVALDVEPSATYERKLVEIGPENARVQSPFWMGYYDAGGSVAYVHSIDQYYGEVFGVPRAAGFAFRARWHRGGEWSSKRLIDAEGLRRADAYLVNYSSSAGETTIRWRAHPDGAVLSQQTVTVQPHGAVRVSVSGEDVARASGPVRQLRLEVDGLLTENGKPYVMLRYGDGPFSLHHG
jgi:hypothetical protein